MKNHVESFGLTKNNFIKVAALFAIAGTVSAASVTGGNLDLEIDRTALNSIGNAGGISTYVEHYFDQPTSNVLTAPQLFTTDLDNQVEPATNLTFAANGATVVHPLDPSVAANAQHLLQPTDFQYSDASDVAGSSTGQIGFGGVLRLGFGDVGLANTDLGLGNIAFGDFTLSYNESRITDGAAGASGWLIQTTTGIPGTGHPLRNLFDITNESVDVGVDSLSIIGTLLWAPESAGFFQDIPELQAGTFSMTSTTVDVAAVPVPAAVWLFGTGLVGLVGMGRAKAKQTV